MGVSFDGGAGFGAGGWGGVGAGVRAGADAGAGVGGGVEEVSGVSDIVLEGANARMCEY